ncbi:MAG: acetate--CoA ligase [Deltaproteobacteria bacterium]|nr:acetate--CoA ligase [Deltaproteobacteria bacterium]MBI3294853.1 acetate--CoA ligase [Deltaproteobacteria bacterium]
MSQIETVLKETREFAPSQEFVARANLQPSEYQRVFAEAARNPIQFWEGAARNIDWFQPWQKTFEWKEPHAKWFVGGQLNASYNCLDRHLKTDTKNKLALIWEGEDGHTTRLTYQELFERVCQLANAMESKLDLRAGDFAAIYMPLVPEAVVTMLACARIGVTHSVIFAGFSAHAVRDRINDARCKVVFTADETYRKGQPLNLISIVRQAVAECPGVQHTVVLTRNASTHLSGREVAYQAISEAQPKTHTAKPIDAEHPLFVLYTSGTTGKPKGILHTTGGYLTGVNQTARWVFDLKPNDIYWCTADIGWITGHSYVVYGILSLGMTSLIYEGVLNHPHPGRIWEIADRHKVTILYTAPTAIRSFMRAGEEHPNKYPMASLRLLGTVGEPINPEAWIWYQQTIGKGRCPIVDTWWQTETGGIMISPIPGVVPTKPGSATKPFPGILADIVDENGKSCGPNEGGYLVIKHPWPSMARTILGDPDRFRDAYWTRFPGMYFTGDGAHKDAQGYFWIKGRVDDVINVSGHRLGTMEIESALVSHPSVAEAAVVGPPDELKGQSIVAFVIPKDIANLTDLSALEQSLKRHVANEIGAIARPDRILLTRTLPKTRSGKIMRRLLKDFAAGKTTSGDTTTLENPNLVDLIK